MLHEAVPVHGTGSGVGGSSRQDAEGAVENAAGGIGVPGHVDGGELGHVPRGGEAQPDPSCGEGVRAFNPAVKVVAQDEGCFFRLIHVRIAVVPAFSQQFIALPELVVLHGLRDQGEEQRRAGVAAVLQGIDLRGGGGVLVPAHVELAVLPVEHHHMDLLSAALVFRNGLLPLGADGALRGAEWRQAGVHLHVGEDCREERGVQGGLLGGRRAVGGIVGGAYVGCNLVERLRHAELPGPVVE